MIRTFIVTSSDGIQFSVQVYSRTQEQASIAEQTEARYAARKTAAELTAHGDFHQMAVSLADLVSAPVLPRKTASLQRSTAAHAGQSGRDNVSL